MSINSMALEFDRLYKKYLKQRERLGIRYPYPCKGDWSITTLYAELKRLNYSPKNKNK